MKKLIAIGVMIPSLCFADVIHPNNPDVNEIVTYSGTGEALVNGTESYCSKVNAVFDYDNSVEVNFTCGINSTTLLGNYDNLSDTIIMKINSIEFDSVSDAEGLCEIDTNKQEISCIGKNVNQNYNFKFKVKTY